MKKRPKIVIKPKTDHPKLNNPDEQHPSPSGPGIRPKLTIKKKTQPTESKNYRKLLTKYEASKRLNERLRKTLHVGLPLTLVVILLSSLIILKKNNIAGTDSESDDQSIQAKKISMPEPTALGKLKSYFSTSHIEEEGFISENQSIREFLSNYNITEEKIQAIKEEANLLGIETLKEKKAFMIGSSKLTYQVTLFAYEPDYTRYLLFSTEPEVEVIEITRKIEQHQRAISGIVRDDLLNAVSESFKNVKNINILEVIHKMEEALKWSIDFYHLSPGDKFKLVYDEKMSDREVVEIGRLKAVYFKHKDKEINAFYVNIAGEQGYFDKTGKSMRRAFLKSPLKYGRLTSPYNLERIHPIRKKKIPHLGTDYAADEGTDILSVGDGTVIEARFKKNNGNYIKVKHDHTYTTQYLHMKGFAPGIDVGTKVKQGQVLGYVGQTGLATGPHVCFRFWKNGKQVNHLEEDLVVDIQRLALEQFKLFKPHRDSLSAILDSIKY